MHRWALTVHSGMAVYPTISNKLWGNVPLRDGVEGFRIGPPREIRTPDTQVRSLVLYPAELWADSKVLLESCSNRNVC